MWQTQESAGALRVTKWWTWQNLWQIPTCLGSVDWVCLGRFRCAKTPLKRKKPHSNAAFFVGSLSNRLGINRFPSLSDDLFHTFPSLQDPVTICHERGSFSGRQTGVSSEHGDVVGHAPLEIGPGVRIKISAADVATVYPPFFAFNAIGCLQCDV